MKKGVIQVVLPFLFVILLIVSIIPLAVADLPPPPPSPNMSMDDDSGGGNSNGGGGSQRQQNQTPINYTSNYSDSNYTSSDDLFTGLMGIEILRRFDDLANRINALERRADQLSTSQPQSRFPLPPDAGTNIWLVMFWVVIALIVIGACIVGGIFLYRRRRSKVRVPQSLRNYIKATLAKGYTLSVVRRQLEHEGWSPEQIAQAYNEVIHGR
jgi:hypothetical protein